MALSICCECKRVVDWDRKKHLRMSHVKCPRCGGGLRRINPVEWRKLRVMLSNSLNAGRTPVVLKLDSFSAE